MKINNNQRNMEAYMSDSVVSTVPADGLAELVSGASAFTVIKKVWYHIFNREK